MLNKKDVEKLAELSRIGILEEEKEQIAKEIDSILGYVSEIKNAKIEVKVEERVGIVKNTMREDVVKDATEDNSEELLNVAPKREGDYISVKKILNQNDFDE